MMHRVAKRSAVATLVMAVGLTGTMAFADLATQRHNATDDEQAAIDFVVNFCLSAPSDIGATRASLEDVGWSVLGAAFEDDETDPGESLTMEALIAAGIVFDLREDDLAFTVRNAGFRAMSILGNSSLGPDQIGLRHGDLRLAILGVMEGTPHCTITGPPWLASAAQHAGLQDTMSQRSDLLYQAMGIGEGGIFQMSIVDVDDLREGILADPEAQDSQLAMLIDAVIMPVSIVITPNKTVSEIMQRSRGRSARHDGGN